MYDILTFGDLCVDLILSGGDVTPEFGQVEKLVGDFALEIGGSCSIFSCQAAKLGLKVALLGHVGCDTFGEFVLSHLTESGVDTQFITKDPSLKTGLGIAFCKPNDRAILTYPGTITAVQPSEVTVELLSSARHLHHGSYFLQTSIRPEIPEIFARARKLGVTTSLDTNWDPDDRWDGVRELLPLTDVFLPNEQELARITVKGDEWFAGLKTIHEQGTGIIAVKRGASGAVVFDGQKLASQAVVPVFSGDSIGAGDSFDAGFLTGWLRRFSLADCLRLGCLCGSGVASKIGGVAGQPRWEEIQSQFSLNGG